MCPHIPPKIPSELLKTSYVEDKAYINETIKKVEGMFAADRRGAPSQSAMGERGASSKEGMRKNINWSGFSERDMQRDMRRKKHADQMMASKDVAKVDSGDTGPTM